MLLLVLLLVLTLSMQGNICEKGFKDGLSRIFALEDGGAVGAMTCELQLPTPARSAAPRGRRTASTAAARTRTWWPSAAARSTSATWATTSSGATPTTAAGTVSGAPSSCALAPGAGPRRLDFHQTLPVAYVVAELSVVESAAPLCALPGDDGQDCEYRPADGTFLKDFAKTAAEGSDQWTVISACAAIRVSPSKKWVLASNRGHDSLAVFAVDETTGALSKSSVYPSGGKTPRDFMFVNERCADAQLPAAAARGARGGLRLGGGGVSTSWRRRDRRRDKDASLQL